MIIVGIDPGSRHTGYGVIERQGSRVRALDQGRLSPSPKLEMAERLASLSLELEKLLERWQPEAVAVESVFHGINSRSLIVLAQARGAILALAGRQRLVVREFSPAEIKSAVTGNGRAEKEQVGKMVRMLLAMHQERASEDALDALAAALTYAQTFNLDRVKAQLKSP